MPKDAPGTLIAGRYEVLRPLGRGGMGKVFLVKDRKTGQQLALKALRAQYQYNERVIARFAREVQAIRKLDHPCIVKIFDARRDGDLLFYTMEFIQGKSLRDWLHSRGKLQFASVVRVLCLVAHALEHAHKITIHRDISPENIMVLPDGSVRLCDFGLAKLEDQNQGLTIVGMNLGKIQYNAPEQRTNAAHVDHRADIYPLGIMFYELLTGRLPDSKTRISELRPDLPKEVDDFFDRSAASRPEDRFASAAEFHQALLDLYNLNESRAKPTMIVAQEDALEKPSRWAALRVWLKRLFRRS